MILYHFTYHRRLDGILSAGIKPGADGVVWLTTNSETIYACDQYGRPLGPERAHNCRIKLVIPSSDRRLSSWRRRLRPDEIKFYLRNPYLGREKARRTVQDWYCYSGTAPSDCCHEIRTPERLIDTAGRRRLQREIRERT